MDNYMSDWLISSSVNELKDKINLFETVYGIPKKFITQKINCDQLINKKTHDYDIIYGDMFTISQKIIGKIAIVNAANSDGLGCFNPIHKCIDNQLHRYEGPRLRLLLNQLPIINNKRINIADSIVTQTFRLNIDYVIHTVAPDCSNKKPDNIDWNNLIKCYDNCIKIADTLNLDYIIFPALGTGIFGFPKKESSIYVHNYLKQSFLNRKVRVILCIYS
jgi:O-acetyl-ADP-ribose deacetylase (regulator of RNase III)